MKRKAVLAMAMIIAAAGISLVKPAAAYAATTEQHSVTAINGLVPADDGTWYYYDNGFMDTSYTGLAYDETVGWWYVENGAINFDYTGLISNEYGWWCVAGGRVAFEYTGLWYDENVGWWYVENGAINFDYTGLIPNEYGWWCVAGGAVIFDYTGLWYDENVGWWYVENGAINFDYTGMMLNDYGWWYVTDGALDWGFNGLGENEFGKWVYENGGLNFNYNGTYSYGGVDYNVVGGHVKGTANNGTIDGSTDNGSNNDSTPADVSVLALAEDGNWYYYTKGVINRNYTGMAEYENNWYYVQNGQVDFDFSGIAENQYGMWLFTDGAINYRYHIRCTSDGENLLTGSVGSLDRTYKEWGYVVWNGQTYTICHGQATLADINVADTLEQDYPSGYTSYGKLDVCSYHTTLQSHETYVAPNANGNYDQEFCWFKCEDGLFYYLGGGAATIQRDDITGEINWKGGLHHQCHYTDPTMFPDVTDD